MPPLKQMRLVEMSGDGYLPALGQRAWGTLISHFSFCIECSAAMLVQLASSCLKVPWLCGQS